MTPVDAGTELDPVHPVPLRRGTRRSGLRAAEVAARAARGEVNDVPVRSSRSVSDIVRGNVFTRFNALIGAMWLIMLVVAPVQDSLFGYVILANTGIGIVQELRAKRTLDGLAVVGESRPTVRRDGTAQQVPADRIVLGDLIETGPGARIVVDGICVEAEGLEVDESLLTGEADAVVKRPGDRLLSGSFVVAGSCTFEAVKVGRDAYAARLTEEAARFTLVRSELRSGVSTILKYVTWMMVPTAVALAVSQLAAEHTGLKESVARAVGGIAPMVPEGLVLLTSVAFAIGVVRLGRRRCLVQELPAIEGLARVDTVCLDKTGTLTESGMTVSEVRILDGPPSGTAPGAADGTGTAGSSGGTGEIAVGRVLAALAAADPRPNASMRAVAEAFPFPGGGRPEGVRALPFSSARGYCGAEFPADTADPAGPASGDGHRDVGGSAGGARGPVAWFLGAPDVLLPAGHPVLDPVGELHAQGLRVLLLARAAGTAAGEEAQQGAGQGTGQRAGQRAGQEAEAAGTAAGTGAGARTGAATGARTGTGTGAGAGAGTRAGAEGPGAAGAAVPVALVALTQRLRADAPDILRYLAAEEVDTKVLSGDHAVSVGAVAARLGLPGADTAVDARTLPADGKVRQDHEARPDGSARPDGGVVPDNGVVPDGGAVPDGEALGRAVEAGTVFGRVTPAQKQRMIRALQSRGHVVAMTGDGVNDVLALKDADIGVAMGSGSEATRAVAQVVLLDDSFAMLPAVVAEGRRVIGNITRVATLFLLKTVYSVLLAVLVVCFGVAYPFLPRHLTLLSTLTIGVPAFFLALAPNTERAEPHFVRRVMRYAIPGGILTGAATFASYLLARHHYTRTAGGGTSPAVGAVEELAAETSAATLTLFLISMWVVAIVARPYTWWRVCLVAALAGAFLVVLTVPALQRFFAVRLVGTVMPWTAVGIAAVAAVGLEWVWRWAGRKFTA